MNRAKQQRNKGKEIREEERKRQKERKRKQIGARVMRESRKKREKAENWKRQRGIAEYKGK